MSLEERLERLATLFNEGSLDVPGGLIDRECVFRLNGVAYEETMGRPVSDPLVRLVARGAAAYRLLAQAVRYAMPDVQARLDGLTLPWSSADGLTSGHVTLRGTLRGESETFQLRAAVALIVGPAGRITEVAVLLDEDRLAALRQARGR